MFIPLIFALTFPESTRAAFSRNPPPGRRRPFTAVEDARAGVALGLNPAEWVSRLDQFERTLDPNAPDVPAEIEFFVGTELARRALDPAAVGALGASAFYNHYALTAPRADARARLTGVVLRELGEPTTPGVPAWDAVFEARRAFRAGRRVHSDLIGRWWPYFDRAEFDRKNLRPGVKLAPGVAAVFDFKERFETHRARLSIARQRLLRATPSNVVDLILEVIFEIELRVANARDLREAFRAERFVIDLVRGARLPLDLLPALPWRFEHPDLAARPGRAPGDPTLRRWLEKKWFLPAGSSALFNWRVKKLKDHLNAAAYGCDDFLT